MGNKKFLDGLTFGRLKVIKDVGVNKNGKYLWLCRCECGNEKTVLGQPLMDGRTKSCGCLRKDELIKRLSTHGLTCNGKLPDGYSIWVNVKQRCYNKDHIYYGYYGGRGLTVCERWFNSFEYFMEDMGKRPSKRHSIERVNNNNGYSPGNCRWATAKEQSRNKRNNIWIEHNGEKLIVSDWANKIGIMPQNLTSLLKANTLSEILKIYEQKRYCKFC